MNAEVGEGDLASFRVLWMSVATASESSVSPSEDDAEPDIESSRPAPRCRHIF